MWINQQQFFFRASSSPTEDDADADDDENEGELMQPCKERRCHGGRSLWESSRDDHGVREIADGGCYTPSILQSINQRPAFEEQLANHKGGMPVECASLSETAAMT